MGKILITGGSGSGLDPDELTAAPAQVLTGYTAGVKGNDEPASGAMANRGAVSSALNSGQSYTIPEGYHNGNGRITANPLSGQTSANAAATDIITGKTAWVNGARITGTMANRGAVNAALNCGGSYTIPQGYHSGGGKITANNLASQTGANAAAGHILSGITAWVNGAKVTGNIPSQGGSTTTPGTANKTIVTAGKYITGNVVVAGSGNLRPEYIKKGVNIFGVVGTWEGYVATANDLYKRGINSLGFTAGSSYTVFESGQITYPVNIPGKPIMTGYDMYILLLTSTKTINTAAYTRINIECKILQTLSNKVPPGFEIVIGSHSASVNVSTSTTTASVDISSINVTNTVKVNLKSITKIYIYRIWAS